MTEKQNKQNKTKTNEQTQQKTSKTKTKQKTYKNVTQMV